MTTDWKETGAGNQILDRGGFFLSYRLCGLFDAFIGDETAIVWYDKYLILNGDHRPELENKSIEECLGYFLNHSDLHSPTSNKFVL